VTAVIGSGGDVNDNRLSSSKKRRVLPMKTRFAMLLVCAAGAVPHAFAQVCPSAPATPKSPINMNVAAGAVTFNWDASPASGVTGYEVRSGQTVGNASAVCSTNGSTSCAASLAARSYGWLVRTKFTTC